jgi:hypothetical protein
LTQLVVSRVARQHAGEIVPVRALELVRSPATLQRGLLAIERSRGAIFRHRVPVPRGQLCGRRIAHLGRCVTSERGDVALGRRAIRVVRSFHVGDSPYSPFSGQVTESAAPPS